MRLSNPGASPRALALVAVAALALASANPARAADVALENLSFGIGPITYRIPKIEFRGTSLGKAEIEEILSKTSTVPLSQRLARLAAREIVVPEVAADVTAEGVTQTSTYRDLVASEVGGGRIRGIVGAGGQMRSRQGGVETTGSFGRMELQDVDLVLGAAVLTETAQAAPEPLKKLYGSFSLDKLVTTTPGKATSAIDRIVARDILARPTKDGWLGMLSLKGAGATSDKLSPEDRKRLFGMLGDMWGSLQIGLMEATGTVIAAEAPGAPNLRIDRIALRGAGDRRGNEFSVDGVSGTMEEGEFRLSRVAISNVDLAAVFAAVSEMSQSGEAPTPAQARKLIPAMGNFALSGLDIGLKGRPGPDGATAPAAQPLRVQVAGVEIASGKPLQGLPTDLSIGLRNVSFDIPRDSKDANAQQLLLLGYDKVDLSFLASLLYDPAKQELALRELSLDGRDMGRLALRATIGGVSPDLFDPDTAVASVALLGAAARSANITVSNQGLAQRLLSIQAARQGRTAEDVRREYGTMAAVGIPALLGSSDGAKTLGRAIAQFVAQPGRLTIDATSKSPTGFGVADFAAAPDPASIFDKLDITASAQ